MTGTELKSGPLFKCSMQKGLAVMKNKDALIIANSLLCEIRLLLNQGKAAQAQRVAEIGQTLPTDEANITREVVTYEKLFNYMNDFPDRQDLLHFMPLLQVETQQVAQA